MRRVWPRVFTAAEFAAFVVALWTFAAWLCEGEDRATERRYRAWELINSAAGKPGDGGRTDALQNLVKDNRPLAGATLDNAHLPEINLGEADLSNASMQSARLYGADLGGAVLNGADLRDADLSSSMTCPDTGYRWSEHDVPPETCEQPVERRTNLRGAFLWDADLRGADLNKADLKCAVLHTADLRGVKNLKQDQLNSAFGGKATKLPHDPPDDATSEEAASLLVGVEVLKWPCHWQIPMPDEYCDGSREPPKCD
ncbi:MAG: pentapeptide repeat-containing protein [Rhodospirillales bacterium]|nr:pentapeptide repeat-containing protein [Rhodospirillales bacterium]